MAGSRATPPWLFRDPGPRRGLTDLLDAIERRLAQPYSLTEAAAFLSLTPGYLSEKFRAAMGCGFVSYVMARRLRRACFLLRDTDQPVCGIAAALGFRRCNYFSRVFREKVGITPTQFRRATRAPAGVRRRSVSARAAVDAVFAALGEGAGDGGPGAVVTALGDSAGEGGPGAPARAVTPSAPPTDRPSTEPIPR